MMDRSFEELVAEADRVPIHGWDFSWLEGRAFEERPSWRYSDLVAKRARDVSAMLDVQSGGGEMLSRLPRFAPLTVAAEGWKPNVPVAAARLRRLGVRVVAADTNRPSFPFTDASFDLITARHPVETCWPEIARVLRPGGTFLSQQIGPHTVGELTEFMMGPQPSESLRDPELARRSAESVGMQVRDLRIERPRTVFNDVGAVVYFLRLVVWIVPDFTVDAYRDRLLALHERIERDGPFIAHAARFLIQAKKSDSDEKEW
jgi:SAM-dependent methyltransferase